MAQGEMVAELVAGKSRRFAPAAIPAVCFTDPEVVVVGQNPAEGVSELAAAFSQSMEMGARLEDVGGTIHAHPTLGEAVQEAALRALGHALHV